MGIQINNLEHITEMPKQKPAFGSSPTMTKPIQGQDEDTLTNVVGGLASLRIFRERTPRSTTNNPIFAHMPPYPKELPLDVLVEGDEDSNVVWKNLEELFGSSIKIV
ncbi:MAG: hypothetical protein F6J90_17530 [Moorea sp. SIOASIH]|uniref:hypothetical protein n=1 Tax=Moorena sp. SIOASIH TaxID=2607817 RepID=UPI0013B75C23|nr:hypothetical protein [Moorena sp. SIOASIH]NEO38032.1 hypothetical protein [Moorena sp. SIOASIH]